MPDRRSYRSPSREAARERTRERILVATAKQLRSGDVPSLDGVARAAGVTRLTVYNLFGSRSALFEAVFDRRAQDGGLDRIAEVMSGGDARTAVAELAGVFVDFWSADAQLFSGLSTVAASDIEFAALLEARNERRRRAFGTLVQRLVIAGALRPAAAGALTDMLFALTSQTFYSDLCRAGKKSPAVREAIVATVRDAVTSAVRGPQVSS